MFELFFNVMPEYRKWNFRVSPSKSQFCFLFSLFGLCWSISSHVKYIMGLFHANLHLASQNPINYTFNNNNKKMSFSKKSRHKKCTMYTHVWGTLTGARAIPVGIKGPAALIREEQERVTFWRRRWSYSLLDLSRRSSLLRHRTVVVESLVTPAILDRSSKSICKWTYIYYTI